MPAAINPDCYSDGFVVPGTAGPVASLVRRIGLSTVIAYLVTGAKLGPLGLGSLIGKFPLLCQSTVVDADTMENIGELGFAFLLFVIRVDSSCDRLMTMRRLVFGLGNLRVQLLAGLISGVARPARNAPGVLLINTCIALSSTAVVIEVSSLKSRMVAGVGRASFAVLLAQDLATIPILLFVSTLAGGTHGFVLTSLLFSILNAAEAMVAIVLGGRLPFRPLFRLVPMAASPDLFVATTLLINIGSGAVAALASLSMPCGGFTAALLLANNGDNCLNPKVSMFTVQGCTSGHS